MTNKKDDLFQRDTAPSAGHKGGFEFNREVADVFADMINRSVPGYAQIVELIPSLIRCYGRTPGHYYDLGCSLGAGMLAMASAADSQRRIIGVDNSAAMIEAAKPAIDEAAAQSGLDLQLECADLLDYQLQNAAVVLMNFTLQFIQPDERDALLERICSATVPTGVLILSEKISSPDPQVDQALIDLHHQFKADQGYSQLEISRKRDAIENVLIPESLAHHEHRLKQAGYRIVTPWIQNLQFVSLLAIK
ncbi:MAG: carboxy-S-adenosyl-L-methionine synthase CmoA [Gammaproteobacteria bacterium]|nr:carboxy-S-adenosyl-L-methionine synthase CmoA [Gammaproteobacteria bacterium]